MNPGLLLKAARETWPGTVLFCAAFFIVEAALGFVLPRFQAQFSEQLLRLPFVETFVRGLVGADLAAAVGPDMFYALAWVHPVVLAVVWAHAIVHCTRVPAGEVDRGTIDVLLGLPVSRWQVHISEVVVWLGSMVALFAAGLLGNRFGSTISGATIPPGRSFIAAANLAALYLTVGGAAWVCGALSDRRGRAVGASFLFVAGAFLANYLAQFWKPLERLALLSPMHYHRPMLVLSRGTWPVRDVAILLVAACALWLLAGICFSRRDLTTT